MRKSRSETLWNEEIRRCEVVEIAENVREEKLRWDRHVIKRNEREPFATCYKREKTRNGLMG
jgi:hypothetical protein